MSPHINILCLIYITLFCIFVCYINILVQVKGLEPLLLLLFLFLLFLLGGFMKEKLNVCFKFNSNKNWFNHTYFICLYDKHDNYITSFDTLQDFPKFS